MSQAPAGPPFSQVIAQDRGRLIHVQVGGSGEPTVVLLTGLGTPAAWWHASNEELDGILTLVARETWEDDPFIAPELAQNFRVVTYDRAGMQASTPPAQSRALDDFLQELQAVLRAVNVDHPVVLIGHSIGGLIALEYARRYPDQIHALVLLDSSHPDQNARFAVASSAEQLQTEVEHQRWFLENHPERPDLDALCNQGESTGRVGCLGEVPLLVVSRASKPGHELDPPFDPNQQHREEIWQALQTELVLFSKQGQQLRLASPYHYVYLDQPRVVLQGITTFLEQLHA